MERIRHLQDEITIAADSPSSSSKQTLLFFIPGNPGMVEYYRGFLENVKENLSYAGNQGRHVTIYGASHDGFEIHPTSSSHAHPPPFSLEEVIEGTKRKLKAKVRELGIGDEPVEVVLVGHSVGAYILLEVLTWWRNQKQQEQEFKIVGGVGLFPTIVDIAKSEKGKIFSILFRLPFIPFLTSLLATLLTFIPLSLWNWPKTFTPGEKRPEHNIVTEAVIRSPHGAKQTVFMAADEMLSIRDDKWLWDPETGTKLFFYWGENDYWVDNQVRDEVIGKRGKREGGSGAEMLVDREAMDHCFSLNEEHCEIVAKQVAGWVRGL